MPTSESPTPPFTATLLYRRPRRTSRTGVLGTRRPQQLRMECIVRSAEHPAKTRPPNCKGQPSVMP
ncbi:hypothetical protein C8R44DRAFT_762306 [Mycena epipterygia]|nr:hypothetical protein C8R44DRAFT_762306 [Mycena epipterygia]